MDIKLIIALVALIISILSLTWNIWAKLNDNKKKLLIQCFKMTENCTITIINTGKKPIYVRRIEIEEKEKGKITKPNIAYNNYCEKFEMNPLLPETWRTIVIKTNPHFTLINEKKKFKKTRLIVIDGKGEKYKTNWFRQNNLN